ncbi:hypothetical protein PISL3812_08645 [Talaromyces islandicus]|uniref:Rhodopsin domain-containing protein n=1 Tax=Talaromyces islandicus TaxID=28573 RepID=A0A0U1M7M6_TALIS|nr:hypothetical protein PISL3812_08645 [Talaromyces islandicus]
MSITTTLGRMQHARYQPHEDSNTDNIGPAFLVLTSVLTSFSIVTTTLRCFARAYRRSLGWDDYMIAIATVLIIARSGLQIASVSHGNGKHRSQVSDPDYSWVVMQGWYTQVILFPTLCLVKCSICSLLLRIIPKPRTKWVLWGIMVGLVLTNLEPVIVLLAECSPVKTYWDPHAGTCWNPDIRIYSIYLQVGYSALTDLICALMPIYVVYSIQMPMKDKILLCGLMSLGLVATACALVRASSLGTSTKDLTYDYCVAAIWANVELHLGIIAANAACGNLIYGIIRSCFHHRGCLPKLSQNSNGYRTHGSSGFSASRSRSSRGGRGYLRSVDAERTDYHSALSGNSGYGDNGSPGRCDSASVAGGPENGLSLHPSRESEIPLQDGIFKKVDYVMERSEASESDRPLPGNGNWFIDGRLSR